MSTEGRPPAVPEGLEPPPGTDGTHKLLPPPKEHPLLGPPAGGPPGRRPRRRRWFWFFVAGAILLAILLFRDCGRHAGTANRSAGPPPAAVTAGRSTSGDMNVYIEALGTVTPINTITVYSQITGRVMSVYYHEGQMVHEGDALIDIDPRPYQAQLTQAEGTLARDRALLAEARIDLQRYQAAFAKNAIAGQQVEDQGQLVLQYEGTVKADEGMVSYDQTQLSYCHIVAPVSGRVGLRLVDPGNTVFAGSGSTLVVITQLQPITVVFNVSEDDLPQVEPQLRAGHSLPVAAFDRSDVHQLATGNLTSLDNQVDTTTGTVRFRAGFPNQNLALFPNQFVNARLLVKTLRRVTLLPNAALQHNGTAAFVYVVKPDQTVEVQSVTPLNSNDTETAVTGLNAGVEVATSGFDRLENGAKVLIRGQGNPRQAAPGNVKTTPGPGLGGNNGNSTP